MAVTFTASHSDFSYQMAGETSGRKVVTGLLNLGTYATGGVTLAASDFDSNASAIVDVIASSASVDGALLFSYDKTNTKMIAFDAIATEEGDATDISAAGKGVRVVAVLT